MLFAGDAVLGIERGDSQLSRHKVTAMWDQRHGKNETEFSKWSRAARIIDVDLPTRMAKRKFWILTGISPWYL
jgi:hypothetical protein